MQVLEQPSPETVLPSSHSSPASTLPFPQTVEQAVVVPAPPAEHVPELERQVGSLVQVFEHPVPSPLKRPFGPVQPLGSFVGSVPQSHDSPAPTTPSPQTARVHLPACGADGVPGQVAPGSRWQVEEQPSPLLVFPSSHCSPPVIMLS